MMDHDYWNLWPQVIFGREEDDSAGDNDGDDEGNDDDADDDDSSDDSQSTEGAPTGRTDADFENLQKALKAERRQNAKNARELKKLQAAQGQRNQEEQTELERVNAAAQASQAKAEKLAAGLLKRDIDGAITKFAVKHKFLDVEDALNGVNRSEIVFDQDSDDPTDIDIDEDSVEKVVKALAAKKPHFLSRGTDDGEATGSPMGGRKKGKKPVEDTYKELYPSL